MLALLGLLAAATAPAAEGSADPMRQRLAELSSRRARVIEERRVDLDENGVPRGSERRAYGVRVGADTLSHWEFAQLAAGTTGRAVPGPMRQAFDPPNRRLAGVQLGLFAGGVVAVAVASLIAGGTYLDARDCGGCTPTTMRYVGAAITGGLGLAFIGGGALYRANTVGARDPRGDYFSRRELELLVDEYNRALASALGLPVEALD